MTCLSSLSEDLTALVLDTSVIVNLHASTLGESILTSIPNDIYVPKVVIQELDHKTSKVNGEYLFMQSLLEHGVVKQADMHEGAWTLFESLTTSDSSLGDGEASTTAIAATSRCLPVIDDLKGRSQASKYIMNKSVAWTLDLLLHPGVKAVLNGELQADAVYLALRDGRMRIDKGRFEAVVDLIGVERAIDCASLPNYKAWREVWLEQLESKATASE